MGSYGAFVSVIEARIERYGRERLMRKLKEVRFNLSKAQVDLDPVERRVLGENKWDLYE